MKGRHAVGMSRRHVRDRCLELERVITGRFHSGSLGLDDAVKLFHKLLQVARPASISALNHILTVVSRAQGRGSALLVSLFNQIRMVRASPNKVAVAPDLHTYSIIIYTFSTIGCLHLSFAAFGLVIKTGFRVDDIVISQLIKGLCDSKRVSEAMDVLLRRMPEFGCTPDVFSYTQVLKALL